MTPDPNEITARDRIEAFRLAREADDLAVQSHPVLGWPLRKIAALLRWMATPDREDDDVY